MQESPLPTLMMADAAHELYVKPSGLSAEEKQQADLTMTRVARGVFDKRIGEDELEIPLDYISAKDFNGRRQPKESVTDDAVRAMIAECKKLANAAGIAKTSRRVDVGDEFKRVVDKVFADNS
jgi:hypothetical protein